MQGGRLPGESYAKLTGASGSGESAKLTHPRLVDSLVCTSLLWFWLSHVALADTKWLRVESVRRGGEERGPGKEAEARGPSPAPLCNLSHLVLLSRPRLPHPVNEAR